MIVTKKKATKKPAKKDEPTVTIREVAEWLLDWGNRFEASEKDAAKQKLWPLASEYRSRWTTVDMLIGSLERGEISK